MDNFDSFYSKIITQISTSFFSNKYTGGIVKIDHNHEFIDRIKTRTGLDIKIERKKFNNNFPQLASHTCRVSCGAYDIQSNSSEVATADGLALSRIRAQGEFMERLSSIFPLKEFISNDFNPSIVFKKIPVHLYAKKLFSFGYKKVHSTQIYYGLFGQNKKEIYSKIKYQPTTSGGAGHFNKRTAILNGLLELIQRDGFLVYWLNTISPRRIDVDSYLMNTNSSSDSMNALTKLVSDFKKYNLEYHFLDITSDITVPTACCILITDSPTGRRVALGASSGFDGVVPLISAATEATSVLESIFFKEPFILKKNYKPFSDESIKRNERLCLYTTDEMVKQITFFFSNPESISVDEWMAVSKNKLENNTKKSLQYLKKIFKDRARYNSDYEVSIYEIQNPLLTYFNYTVVRVFCNGLYSLYLDESFGNPNHPRLAEFVKNKKLEASAKLNPWPHPFP